jgi:hypothetical protein
VTNLTFRLPEIYTFIIYNTTSGVVNKHEMPNMKVNLMAHVIDKLRGSESFIYNTTSGLVNKHVIPNKCLRYLWYYEGQPQ